MICRLLCCRWPTDHKLAAAKQHLLNYLQHRSWGEAASDQHCNDLLFALLQLATGNELAEVKRRVGVLKRVCRQRTQGAWKEWRTSMEEQRTGWLTTHLQLLQQDHAHLQSGLHQVHEVQAYLHQLQTDLRDDIAAQRNQQQVHMVCAFDTLFFHAFMQLDLIERISWLSQFEMAVTEVCISVTEMIR